MKEEINSKKDYSKSKKKKCDSEGQDLCFYFVLLILNRFLLLE